MKCHFLFLLFVATVLVVLTFASARKIAPKIQSRRNISPRIIGGEPANAGQFPSAAAIYVSTNDGTYFCGGSLINQEFVLTAANCISGAVAFQIILGSTTLQGNDPNRQTLSTSLYYLHPDFNPDTLENDIALIKFHLPIEYTDYIRPIYLPTVELIDNVGNTAIGWGQTGDEIPGLNNELNYVVVTTIPNQECQLSYANTIFSTMVCVAGNYNEGTCRGDNGGPLMTVLSRLHWHVGVASFISTNGCEAPDPSGYTRTYSYVDWIKTTAGIS